MFAAGWWVYMAEGCDGHLYCGISTDPARRVREHNGSRRGAKWARAHRPLKMVWSEFAGDKGSALRREREIKRLDRSGKRRLAGLGELP
jgi:putative endonuclease